MGSTVFNMQNRSDVCTKDAKDQIVNKSNAMVISEQKSISKEIAKKLRTANKCYREKLLLYDK